LPAGARAGEPSRRHRLRPWPGLAQTQRPVRSRPRSRAPLSRVSQRAAPDARHSCTHLLMKTGCPKQGDIMASAALLGEVGENFPYHTAKFEAMARKPSGDEDIGIIRMGVNDKVGIRGVGKKARVHGQRRAISVGKIAPYKSPQDGLIFGMAVTVH